MQTPSEPSVIQASATRDPSIQWIGVQWQGGFYAVPLSGVAAVFKASSPTASNQNKLDIEIHDGAPVFMRSFGQCFDLAFQPAPNQVHEEFRWALIVNVPGSVPIGCRVHQVLGPFWDELKSSSVHHDGQDWLLIQARGVMHA